MNEWVRRIKFIFKCRCWKVETNQEMLETTQRSASICGETINERNKVVLDLIAKVQEATDRRPEWEWDDELK